MKAFTDLDQSHKLAEILPLESADMYWDYDVIKHEDYLMVMDEQFDDCCIPAWSLAALLRLLPNCVEGAEPSLIKTFRNDYRIVYDIDGNEDITSEDYGNPIDACYEMVLRLHEQKLL